MQSAAPVSIATQVVRVVRLACLAGAACGAFTLPAGVRAAEAQAADALQEVVVTAEKRSESEQSVPLSMTTFSSQALEQKSINSFFDYATKVPNLGFAPTGDGMGTARTVAIRGISGPNVTSFYIDDTPLPDSIDPRVLDIDHIEVLRGPQGTLYGARSMGGTVRLITKTPELTDVGGEVHAGVSSTSRTDRANYTADGVINIPIVSGIAAVRLSAFLDDEAGYFQRSYCTDPATAGASCTPLSSTGTTTVNNVAAIRTEGFALAFTVKPSDGLTITPRFMYQRANYNGFPLADVLSTPGNGYGYPVPSGPYTLPTPFLSDNFTQARLFNIPEGGYDSWYLTSLGLKWTLPFGELISSTGYFGRKVNETEDESDFVWAAIIGGPGTTPPYLTPGFAPISEVKHYQELMQEIRLVSSLDGPLQFVAGAYFSTLHGQLPYSAYYPPATATGLDDITNGGQPNNGFGIANLVFAQDFYTSIKEPALYGELSWAFNEKWKVTAGLRGYQVKIQSSGYEAGLAVGGGPIYSPDAEVTEKGVNPKFEADYKVTPDNMVYALASRGFRPGGEVPIVPPGTPGTGTDCVAALAQVDPGVNLSETRSYKSDSLWNYEIGTKNSWFDHRLTVNAAGFDIRWSNIQQAVLLSCGFQFIANAGAAESRGGELEVHAAPLRGLDVSVGLGYQHAVITQVGTTSPQPEGSPVYNVPDWTGTVAANYTLPLFNEWMLGLGADASYVGRSFSGNNNASDPRELPAYRLVNSEIRLSRHGFDVAIVGKNLGNEVANLGDSRSLAAEVPGRPRIFINQPRTIGIEFRQHF